jgi:hypothetical protein
MTGRSEAVVSELMNCSGSDTASCPLIRSDVIASEPHGSGRVASQRSHARLRSGLRAPYPTTSRRCRPGYENDPASSGGETAQAAYLSRDPC